MSCIDSDHDGRLNIIFFTVSSGKSLVDFWEYSGFDRYVLDDSIVSPPGVAWTAGYVDSDSLTDLVVKSTDTLRVYESPTINSHPKQVVWRYGGQSLDAKICDLDRDSKREVVASFGNCSLLVFECPADNQYTQVWGDTLYRGFWRFVVGDFDRDGRSDLVTGQSDQGEIDPNVHVFECFGDNDYRKVFMDSLPTPNNGGDLFAGNDMDGNGKPEFLINSAGGGGGIWIMVLWLYESVGDNRYSYFCVDSVGPIPGSASTSASLCADIDADGREEILWSVMNNWLVYRAVGVHQYQRIFNAYPLPGGSGVHCTYLNVTDFNGNGYPEVVESAYRGDIIPESWTKIWEIEGVRLHHPNGGEVIAPGSQFPITWEKFSPPGADSFSLFVSFNNGVDYRTIATIRQSDDTLYAWSVPDSLSDSCKLMIWAYGPPRAGQNTPRGTAWDFSDSSFAIRQTGIAEGTGNRPQGTGLRILQNPTTVKQGVRLLAIGNGRGAELKIYDVSGKVIQSLPITNTQLPITIRCNAGGPQGAALPAGVYFIRLEAAGQAITKKVVVLE